MILKDELESTHGPNKIRTTSTDCVVEFSSASKRDRRAHFVRKADTRREECQCLDDDDATASTVDTELTNSRSLSFRGLSDASHPTSSSSTAHRCGNVETANRTTPLKSALRPPSSGISKNSSKASTERRVRGLWKPKSLFSDDTPKPREDAFERLQDATLEHIFSFFSLEDRLAAEKVSCRFRHISGLEKGWLDVDATEFCSNRPESASAELSRILSRHADQIESLTIRDTQGSINPEELYLPKNLKSLELEGFLNLTDTVWHVLLLSSTANGSAGTQGLVRNNSTKLKSIKLRDCPKLTSKALRSIAVQCPQLEELEFLNCPGIESMQPLAPMIQVVVPPAPAPPLLDCPHSSSCGYLKPRTSSMSRAKTSVLPSVQLNGLFAPPPQPDSQAGLSSLFAPPSTPQPDRAMSPPRDSLSSLFLPPGHSPLHMKRCFNNSNTNNNPLRQGTLKRLTVSLPPSQVLRDMKAIATNTNLLLRLEHLCVSHAVPWTRNQLLDLESLYDTQFPDSSAAHLCVDESIVLEALPNALAKMIVQDPPC